MRTCAFLPLFACVEVEVNAHPCMLPMRQAHAHVQDRTEFDHAFILEFRAIVSLESAARQTSLRQIPGLC